MKSRWYVSIVRPWEGRFNVAIYEAPELGGSPAEFKETVRSTDAVESLLRTLNPQRTYQLHARTDGTPTRVIDDVPPGETVESRIAQGLRKLESPEGSCHFVVVGPPWDEMEAIVSKWREEWKEPAQPPSGDKIDADVPR